MVAPSSPHPSSGGDHAKGNQEQLYSEYHIWPLMLALAASAARLTFTAQALRPVLTG
jgi:hypothetical protein